ncbi:MAG: tetratricopeptide repeat protein [Armatimonadota bacterium]
MRSKDQAIKSYETGLSFAPDHAPGYLALGNCYYHTGKFTSALQAYENAVRLRPDYHEAINNIEFVKMIMSNEHKAA